MPLYINKFLEKADMDSNNFFLRWKNLDKYVLRKIHFRINNKNSFCVFRPAQECQKIFPAKTSMIHDDCRQKVCL